MLPLAEPAPSAAAPRAYGGGQAATHLPMTQRKEIRICTLILPPFPFSRKVQSLRGKNVRSTAAVVTVMSGHHRHLQRGVGSRGHCGASKYI